VVRADGNGAEKTGSKENTEDDEWRMIEAGADDCVAAPFRYREIVARMSAVLRRPHSTKPKARALLRTGQIELDVKRRVARRDGREIHLSPREFDLLAVFMANAGAALTHTKLARSAWGEGIPHNREYLRTYIQSLRNKLESDPSNPQYILTQPWVGYRFCDPLQNKTN
jgi:two-component system KDP operon response regulator KdpE